MSVAVVIPNHLPHLDFLNEWDELRHRRLIVVQDTGEAPPVPDGFDDLTTVTRPEIEADLGKDAWIIPERTSACRSYGYLVAWREGHHTILTLDNDCYPERPGWVDGHLGNLDEPATLDWFPSTPLLPFSRGFPYRGRNESQVWLSHGTWSGVPDLDAPTALHQPGLRLPPDDTLRTVPRWNFFPVCGMNLAWRRDLTPAMWFGVFGPAYGFDQYDDLWAGVLAKRILDHLGYAAVTGCPSVEHRKQSDVYANLRKQAPGMEMNEHLWRHVRDTPLTAGTVTGCYLQLIDGLPDRMPGDVPGWLPKFKRGAQVWAGLFR